ncbi:MAG: hypothetical protein F6K42_26975 [Leptolyngbya sp. SIO1D8]|nr:hypothetical protein [Leptolyngbya sp. SIO1D8]
MPQPDKRSDALDDLDYYVGENVRLDSDVVIASGTVLEAAPGSRLVIESGVCIGVEVVVQAYGGELTLEAGVNVGQGVLLLGAGRVGKRACIGAESTLINPQVDVDQVIPARSLLGDIRCVSDANNASAPPPDQREQDFQRNGKVPHPTDTSSSSNAELDGSDTADVDTTGQASSLTSVKPVYGREQVLQLVQTLFPHRSAAMSDSESS